MVVSSPTKSSIRYGRWSRNPNSPWVLFVWEWDYSCKWHVDAAENYHTLTLAYFPRTHLLVSKWCICIIVSKTWCSLLQFVRQEENDMSRLQQMQFWQPMIVPAKHDVATCDISTLPVDGVGFTFIPTSWLWHENETNAIWANTKKMKQIYLAALAR